MSSLQVVFCSQALIKLGANPIPSFEDRGSEARIAAHLYPLVRDALLSAHPWSFATTQSRLSRLFDGPLADFSHAYQLPSGFLRALSAGYETRGRGIEYRIEENRLLSNADGVILSYLYRPHESLFPPFFVSCLVARLAAEFCLPVTENSSRSEWLARLAQQEFQQAKQIDAQQDMAPRFEDFTLIEARNA